MQAFKEPVYITRPLLADLEKFKASLREIWATKWISNGGNQHMLFEKKIREFLKVPNVCLFNNGTTALITAIRKLQLTGEVLTTPFTFPATPHVLSWNGLTPVFCDIDDKTMNIDADKIEAAITPRTTAILAVHVYGTPCDVIKIQAVADRHGLKVVYDAAHAFNAEIDGVGLGNFGDISMFSFHSTKLFHTGEGGCLTFKNGSFKYELELLKNFGIKNENEVVLPGINGKLNEIQAALGLLNLELVEAEREKRAQLQETYYRELENTEGVACRRLLGNIKSSYQYFVIRINKETFGRDRDFVYEEFKKYNVFTRKYFYPLCSEYDFYKQLPSAVRENLQIAHKVTREVLCLPFYGGLSIADVEKICAILRSFKQK